MKVILNKLVSQKNKKKEVQRVSKSLLCTTLYLHSLHIIIMIAIHLIRTLIAIQKVKLQVRLKLCKI